METMTLRNIPFSPLYTNMNTRYQSCKSFGCTTSYFYWSVHFKKPKYVQKEEDAYAYLISQHLRA